MRYHQPYGVTDENAPYINGDPSIARQGSIIPAEAVEFPQREAVALIEGAKLTPDDANLSQMLYAVRSQRMEAGNYVHSLILLRPDGLREDIWRGTLIHAHGPTR